MFRRTHTELPDRVAQNDGNRISIRAEPFGSAQDRRSGSQPFCEPQSRSPALGSRTTPRFRASTPALRLRPFDRAQDRRSAPTRRANGWRDSAPVIFNARKHLSDAVARSNAASRPSNSRSPCRCSCSSCWSPPRPAAGSISTTPSTKRCGTGCATWPKRPSRGRPGSLTSRLLNAMPPGTWWFMATLVARAIGCSRA